jgi:hypothetical protein
MIGWMVNGCVVNLFALVVHGCHHINHMIKLKLKNYN